MPVVSALKGERVTPFTVLDQIITNWLISPNGFTYEKLFEITWREP